MDWFSRINGEEVSVVIDYYITKVSADFETVKSLHIVHQCVERAEDT